MPPHAREAFVRRHPSALAPRLKSHSEPGGVGVARRRPCPRAHTQLAIELEGVCARETGSGGQEDPFGAVPPRAAKGNDGDFGRLLNRSPSPATFYQFDIYEEQESVSRFIG